MVEGGEGVHGCGNVSGDWGVVYTKMSKSNLMLIFIKPRNRLATVTPFIECHIYI